VGVDVVIITFYYSILTISKSLQIRTPSTAMEF